MAVGVTAATDVRAVAPPGAVVHFPAGELDVAGAVTLTWLVDLFAIPPAGDDAAEQLAGMLAAALVALPDCRTWTPVAVDRGDRQPLPGLRLSWKDTLTWP